MTLLEEIALTALALLVVALPLLLARWLVWRDEPEPPPAAEHAPRPRRRTRRLR